MVVAVHAGQIVFHPGVYSSIISKGAYGVQLFFIVSSLTLFLAYEQRRSLDGENVNKFFFIRRFFRIAPTFYLATCLYIISFFVKNHILLGYYGTISWGQVLIFVSFLSIFYPPSLYILPFGGWTVEVEMFFYFFIPFLFRMISNIKKAVLFFILSWLGYLVLEYFLCNGHLDNCSSYSLLFPSQIPVFAIGIILFHIIKKQTLKIKSPYIFLSLLVVYLGLALILSKKFIFLSEPVLFSLFFGGLVLLMSVKQIRLLQNRVTEFFGKVSYSLYLWHFIIILFFWYVYRMSSHFWSMKPPLAFLAIYFSTLVIGGGVSWLSFKSVEKTGINFGKKLILKISKQKSL